MINWSLVLTLYCHLDLSYPQDKLVALSGVARRFQEKANRNTSQGFGGRISNASSCGMWPKCLYLRTVNSFQIEPHRGPGQF